MIAKDKFVCILAIGAMLVDCAAIGLRNNTTTAQTTLPRRHQLTDRDASTKKASRRMLFLVEVARVELASKQGARRLSTRLVIT